MKMAEHLPNEKENRDLALAHVLLRLGLGVNLFTHGLVRLPKLAAFTTHLVTTMAKTWLPLPLVTATGYAVPFIELITGALLILGLSLRPALVLGSLLLLVLTFGICLSENWTVASEQLIYLFVLAALLATARYDRYSLDAWRSHQAAAVS